MIIGLDIDGVLLDTERDYLVEAELFDIKLGKNHLKDKSDFVEGKRYSWTKEQRKEFEDKWIKVAKRATFMPGAVSIIKMLKKEGHEFIVLSARTEDNKRFTIKEFEEEHLKFKKVFFEVEDKAKLCKENNVDIMIDDNWKNCTNTSMNKIMTLYFRDVNMKRLEEGKYLKEVNNWGEIYKFIYTRERRKKRISK